MFSHVLDSKTLTEAEREKLFENLDEAKNYVGWAVNILSPNVISTCMLQRFVFCQIHYKAHIHLFVIHKLCFTLIH